VYKDWLINPSLTSNVCPLSKQTLNESDEVIRFMNLNIFLLSAIDEYGKNKPPNTALAGFTIPGTNEPMIPPLEEKSQLAQQIRQKLSQFPWISNMIALQAEIIPENQPSSYLSRPALSSSDPLPKPEGYASLNSNKTTSTNEVDSNYTSDPLSTLSHSTGSISRKIAGNTSPIVKKVSRLTTSDQNTEIDVHTAKGSPYTPSRLFRDEDEDKYNRRPIELEALFGSAPTRTGILAQKYRITSERLVLTVALVVTLVVVYLLSMGIDEDITVPLYEESLQVIKQNITQQFP